MSWTCRAYGIIAIRRQMPNSKPTARVFTQDGLALGYLKLGWSEATDELVENETQTLVSLDGRVGPVTTPTVAASGGWSGHRFHLARSLPAGVRPWSGEAGHPTAIRAVASTGWVRSVPLAGSEYAEDTSARLERARAEGVVEAEPLLNWLRRLCRLPGAEADLQMGRWHGDWIPWNLGKVGDTTVAWDWEYSAPSAPLGFDLVHWHFQSRLAKSDGTLSVAARGRLAERVAAEPGRGTRRAPAARGVGVPDRDPDPGCAAGRSGCRVEREAPPGDPRPGGRGRRAHARARSLSSPPFTRSHPKLRPSRCCRASTWGA